MSRKKDRIDLSEIRLLVHSNAESGFMHSTYDSESLRFHLLMNGDMRAVDESMRVLDPKLQGKLSDDPLRNMKYHFTVTAALAARNCISGGMDVSSAYDISDYYTSLGIDAVLFITLQSWQCTYNTWTVEVEYVLRSTHSGNELFHVSVKAMKLLTTDFKGNLLPLGEDADFARRYGCDVETAQRCRLVETLNQYVLKDLPSGAHARQHNTERYIPSHPEYFNLKIHPDGSVQMLQTELYE